MIAAALCLSFVHAAGTSLSLPPPNIQELLKTRIAHQWAQRAQSPTQLHFEDTECSERGTYHYTERSIVLSADTDEWRGSLEISLTGLIEGEKLPFDRVSKRFVQEIGQSQRPLKQNSEKSGDSWKKWAPWVLGAAGLAAGAYMLVERERHIRQVQGLVLNF